GLEALADWIDCTVNGTLHPFPLLLEQLVGLGTGLTPSGDDALAGALITLNELGLTAAADALADFILPLARVRTNKISFAHLAAAAEGEGTETLHDTLAALASADEPAIALCLMRIDR